MGSKQRFFRWLSGLPRFDYPSCTERRRRWCAARDELRWSLSESFTRGWSPEAIADFQSYARKKLRSIEGP